MPYEPHIVSLVEDGLAECFEYHDALDSFVLRAGVPAAGLATARKRADDRNKSSQRPFPRAPKRIVAQELLRDLSGGTVEDDRLVAAVITAFCKGAFPGASAVGQAALDAIRAERTASAQEAAERRTERDRVAREAERRQEQISKVRAAERDNLRNQFLSLVEISDHQARGFRLEEFLNKLFEYEGLEPRGSFKNVGEQIDGSFAWEGRIHLVEAKWTKAPAGGVGFGGLMYKIEGKTADTRGLFISVNGYSPDALTGLQGKGTLRFVCIDGTHLLRSLEFGRTLVDTLAVAWRYASETGQAYLPVGSPAFAARER